MSHYIVFIYISELYDVLVNFWFLFSTCNSHVWPLHNYWVLSLCTNVFEYREIQMMMSSWSIFAKMENNWQNACMEQTCVSCCKSSWFAVFVPSLPLRRTERVLYVSNFFTAFESFEWRNPKLMSLLPPSRVFKTVVIPMGFPSFPRSASKQRVKLLGRNCVCLLPFQAWHTGG